MCILQCLGYCPKSYVRVLTQSDTLTIAREKAAKALKEKGETPEELLRSIKENEAAVAEAQRTVDAWKAIVGEKSRREEAAKAEAERKAAEERERAEKEEKARIEAEKAEEEARVEAERKAEEERKTKEEERKERDENGQPFVVSSDGTTTFGEITEDTGLTAAPIKLSEGMADEKGNGYGLRHIEARHGDQIRKAGFSSVEEFIEQVAKNYDVIKEGSDRNGNKTYRLLLTDKHNNTLMIELSKDGSYWNVNTAGVFKKSYGKDKKEVYNRHTTVKQSAETAETSQADEHSGTQSTSRMNVPTTSADKGTTLPADQQTSDKENTKKVADSEGENTLKAKIEAASADVNTEPTEAQKEAGNYKKGHVQVGTFDITIEQPEGSIRRGTDADGKKWEIKMHNTYGYFRGTEGVDGDHIDVFLSNDIDGWNGRKVFVVDQYNPDGTFDEHKVMLGFNDMDEAKSDYLANYEKGWENGRRITVSTTNLEDFEKWIDSSHRKTKPFSEYSSVNKETVATDKGSEKAEKKQKKQSVFDKAKEIADKEEKKRKADKPKQKPLTEAERKDAEVVARALGYRVEWVDTMEENGTIDADKKVIRIAKDAENPLAQVLGHEVAHGVKRMDGGKFKALQKAAMEVVGEKEWNERIEKKRKLNAYAEGKLAEEVTCDIVGEALNDKEALKRLAESLRGERGILARLRDAVVRMVEYFKNRGDKEGVRRMKAADKLLAEFESALKEGVAPEQVKPEGVDRSVREGRSEKTELTAEERELRDNLVERMRKGGLDVVTDSEEMQRVIDTENERTRMMGAGSVREHRVYHGSGADFDVFDHSHMGEGEGAQAYGWGTYVTEVEGIGRTYAVQNTTTHNDALRALQHDVDAISDQLNRHRDDLKYDEEQLKRANEWRAEAELDYELFKDEAEKLKEKYGEASPEYRNHLFNDIYTDEMKRAQRSVKSIEESIQYRKEKIAELGKALKDKQAEVDELPKKFPHHLYTVEIPDDNGSNYLDWDGHPAESLLKDVGSFLESIGFERVQDNPVRYEKGESTVVLNPNATGADLYAELQEALGGDKKASQALAELGYTGIKYPADYMRGGRKDGAKNYVIFNENDAKITDHTRFLRTADGEVYGLVKDGRIYLDPKVATSETAVHEYTHLWGDMLRRKDSEQWNHTVKELKNSVLWEEVKELYPELKTDDEIADEVLSTFSGRRGAERLREEARKVADGEGGVFTKAKAIETLERVKEAIARFWEGVARMFGINRYRSAEELADMAMRDLLDSKNPMKDESGMRKRGEVGDEGVKSLKGEEAMVALDNIFEDKKTENMPQKVSSLVKFMELFRKPVRTFLGEVVNVKEEVYNKIIREKRTSISGAVLPTLENADFAIRDTDGSTLYIKRFKSENNDNVYNIAVVNKYGEVEDYVSSVHIKSDNNLRNKITKGAELLLPQERITDGTMSRNNSTPDAKVANYSETAKPRLSRKPGESIFDYASRVSDSVDRSVRERVSARDEYEKKVKSKGFQTKEALQNSMLGLQEFMFAIDHASGNKRYIEDIPDFENPILGENRLSSVNKEEMHQVAKTQFKPLMSAVAKLSGNGKESGELYDYMFAKHGLERDAVMRQREAQKEFDKYQKAHPKGTKTIGDFVASLEGKDYAGLTALTAEDGRVKSIQSQIDAIDEQMKTTDDQLLLRNLGGQKKRLKVDLLKAARDAADDIRKAFESNPSHDRSDINELWKRVNEVNGNTLRKLYESGLLTKEAYNDINSMYTHYIPMRGFDQTTSADAYAYLTHSDSAFNAPIKTAKGRSSKADNPIAYMQAMAESARMQGNRNVLVKQKMLNFVRNHPSDLASVSDVWLQYDSVADEWKPVFPDNIGANDSASVVAKKMEAFEDKMKQMAEKHPNLVQRSNEAPDIPYKVVEKGQLNEHQVLVKQNGKSYIITVNGSPRAAQAANGLTNPDTDLTGAVGKVFEVAEALNRQLSSLYTTFKPGFVGANYVRDALYSNTMVYVKEGARYGGSFNLNFAKYNPGEMANLYARYNKGNLDTSNETHRLFLEFMQNGGETGFVNLKQIEKRKSEIAKAIKRDGEISAARFWGGLNNSFDFANKTVENSARFAAYVTSRKSGRSVGRSEYDAKEISVNFNRKGSGRNWWKDNVGASRFYDTEIGLVEINKASVGSSLAHRYSQVKLDAITSLADGFNNAVYLGSMPDFSRQEGVKSHYFAYPINYNGHRNYVFCRAMQDANKNRLYVHEVFLADNIEKGNTLQTAASQPHGGITLYKDILANVLTANVTNNFETSKPRYSRKPGESIFDYASRVSEDVDRSVCEGR